MSGSDINQHVLAGVNVTSEQTRAAAVHVADRVAAEYPHPLDDVMPHLAGRLTADNPAARADLRELLDALGLNRRTT